MSKNTIAIHTIKDPSSQRDIGGNSDNEQTSNNSSPRPKNPLPKWIIALIIVAGILIIAIVMVFIFKKNGDQQDGDGNRQQDPNECLDSNCNTGENDNNALSKKEALTAFESKFEVASKANHLNQVIMKSDLKHISSSNGVESTTLSVFTKAKIDIYTLNESYAGEDSKEFYSRKFNTVITMNSICNVFSDSKTDCELEQILDLNVKNKNLRRTDEEEDLELLKEAILPICIIEHTETNIIISVTCPETLSSNLKEDIILSFKSIKPKTFKGIVEDDSIAGTNITKKDNKNYIDSFVKGCDDYDGDPSIKENCEETQNIVTDLAGNLISMKQNSTKEVIKDEDHKNKIIKTYYIEDVSSSENFDSNNYKKNLDNVFELIKPIMKKEDYFSLNSFKAILEDLMKGDSNTTTSSRRLTTEEKPDNLGNFKDKILSVDVNGINIELNTENDIGLEEGSSTRIISTLKTGTKDRGLSLSQSNLKLNETMNDFIVLSKAANAKASLLQEELNEPLLEIRSYIDTNINDLNNLLSFLDYSPIFDATSGISELSSLPYTLVSSSENLYSNFNEINNNIPYSINDYRINLKQAVSSFLTESHQLLYYIFSNLTETTRILSSKKSKIAEINSYYLNYTDTSFIDIIKKATEILSNYYINEIKFIKPLIDEMLNNFYNESLISAEKIHNVLDTLVEKLDLGTVTINLGNAQEVKKVINNTYNSKMKVKEILSNIVDKFNKSIGYQDNGYFESQTELEANNKSYSEVSSDAIKIVNALDNNELIDTTYDKIMEYFRDQFVALLNYMDQSKRERFPLKENVLKNSLFTNDNIDKIDENFKNDKLNILLFIKNENKEYLKFVNESLDKFKKENQQNLEKYMSSIEAILSDLGLDNLNSIYNETLTYTMNQIDNIIDYNNKLSVEYLSKVIKVGTTHCTSGYKNKYNDFINNLNSIMNYVQLNLKNNLVNKYKNIINQIRSLLRKINVNSIIEKYKNHLSFSEAHLRRIDNLFTRFDKYISDSLFNTNYLPKINNYISNTLKNLDNLTKNLNSLYSQIYKKYPEMNSNNDYIRTESNCWRCCKKHFIWCWSHGTCCNYYSVGYDITETKNNKKLKIIDLNQYTINFDNNYSSIYNEVSNNINNYCNSINKLSTLFDSKKNESLSNNVNYLSSFSNNVESILNNYLGFNLLTSSYNYYQNELKQKIPNELDDILSKWNEVYDKIDEDLNSNLDKFKSNIDEFGLLGSFYYKAYKQNISYGYADSIVQERKNEFNYTIKYYYNLILSKVNKTYSYIMNNIPVNDKPFDEILNTRILQIENAYNNIISKIQASRNQILIGKTQLTFLKVSETNFFLINDYVNDNVDKIDEEIPLRYTKLFETSYKLDIDDTEENVIAKFYLENSQNGKQIKAINEPINKATYTDLQSGVFENLIEENFEIEKDELIKNIIISLKESNEKLIKSYKYEKDKYSEILQNKTYNEFYSKENLEKKINEIYKDGLIDLNETSKNIIYEYLDQVLDNIKEHINNETERLQNTMTLYSNNYKVIEATLNEYKDKIYNEFYSTIFSVVEDFYNQTIDIFYNNYIKIYLEDFKNYTKREKFKEYSFLNITFNLKDTIDETVELIINEYQNLSMTQIEYLHNKNIQNLQLLFSFSSIKNKINSEISNAYNSVLLPVLKKCTEDNPGDEDYNFSTTISSNIDSFLNTNIQKTKEIMNRMKGNKYFIEEDWEKAEFSDLKQFQFQEIINDFDNFTSVYSNQEMQQIKEVIYESLKSNFNLFTNSFIPSFAFDYFDRILKYNEILKIKTLYSNLKYSLTETLIYYIGLCNIHTMIEFPNNLKNKMLSLNDLESTIRSNNNKILSSLNSKFQEFIESTKNYLVEKYISEIKNDSSISEAFKFNSQIHLYIGQILVGRRTIFEDEYKNKMNNYIKNPFIQEYTKTLNKETNEMLDFLEENKDIAKAELNELFTLDPDNVISEIENKLNNTLKAAEAYNLHLKSFNIPDNVKIFLEKYILNEISPKYEEIKNILNFATKDLIKNNLDKNSEKFLNSLNNEEFESKNKEINNNLTNIFNKIDGSLKAYGAIESEYSENLDKEIANSIRIRNLDELDDDRLAYNRRIADVKLDETFQGIKNSSISIKQFIESLNLFKEFEEKINKYTNDLNYQYGISQNIIKKNKDHYNELNDKLYELNEYSMEYYKNVNSSYHKTKKIILELIDKINQLIENCSNITFYTMGEKYKNIKEKFYSKPIVEINSNEDIEISKDDSEVVNNETFSIKSKIENYIEDNEIKFDINLTDIQNPRIEGKVINKNRPKSFIIDITSDYGHKDKFGTKISSEINNISLSVDFVFDICSNKISFNAITDFDEYTIKKSLYQIEKSTKTKTVGGIDFIFQRKTKEEEGNITIIEKEDKIINARFNKSESSYIF